MPASEQTSYNQKTLHMVFAGTSLLLLVGTMLLLAKDHADEYKQYQKKEDSLTQWMANAQAIEAKSAAYVAEKNLRKAALDVAKSAPVDSQLVEDFKAKVSARAKAQENAEPKFDNLDAAFEETTEMTALVSEEKAAVALAKKDDGDGLKKAQDKYQESQEAAIAAREALLSELQVWVDRAGLDEDNLTDAVKAEKSFLDEAESKRGILVHGGQPDQAAEIQQKRIIPLKEQIAKIEGDLALAKDYRESLEGYVRSIRAEEAEAEKQLDDLMADVDRIHQKQHSGAFLAMDWFLSLPIMDAFYTGEKGIDNGWLPNLTINYNFSDVARFDRCATCHRSINKTAPGTMDSPLFDSEHSVTLKLTPPDEQPESLSTPESASTASLDQVFDVYGLRVAPAGEGMFNSSDVTVQFTEAGSLSARAGLQLGDVIVQIGEAPVTKPSDVTHYLIRLVEWGEQITIQVRRGVPHPYASHPRLDLYMTDMSPHPKQAFGCTICHDGQGSATEFRWASHTPNNPQEADTWNREHGWFDNTHWIFPMYPNRFVESGCLKCHHDVLELEPSEQFPEAPAPKLVDGFKLIREYGCYGCHEINGYDGPDKRIGPDLRNEPSFHSAALAVLSDPGLSKEERGWAERIVQHPYDAQARHDLYEAVTVDAKLVEQAARAKTLGEEVSDDEKARMLTETHKLAALLGDVEAPGALRKVGPSLRYVKSKVDYSFLVDWVNKPSDFRPSTKMPQFFHLHEHLDKDGLHDAERFEPIEVRAMSSYLMNASQKFDYLSPPESVTESASAERGQLLFETRGCLACHSHDAFPDINEHQGPDLSRAGAKFNTEEGRKWLYSWIKEPTRYHARTKMPDLFLEPIEEKNAEGKPTGKVSDPAADIVAFLEGSGTDWKPAANEIPENPDGWDDEEKQSLEDLALEYLTASFSDAKAKEYLKQGIPDSLANKIKSAEKTLLGMTPQNRTAKQLEFVGLQSINKYGCFGCHDIPGFEAAKPIGTALADWGRKESSKLAFEQIAQFLATHGVDSDSNSAMQMHAAGNDHGDSQADGSSEDHGATEEHSGESHSGGHGLSAFDDSLSEDEGYYIMALNGHHREGFIWQKLRMPRSYDYQKTVNKGYNERLIMPKFTFNYRQGRTAEENKVANEEAREKIITFVLGLVSEPPNDQYIYRPKAQRKAVMDGRLVLEKYNCAGCHELGLDRWAVDYQPTIGDELGTFDSPAPVEDFPFLNPRFTKQQLADSLIMNHRGLRDATLIGRPKRSEETGEVIIYDEESLPIDPEDNESRRYYTMTLWDSVLVDGVSRDAGLQSMLTPIDTIEKEHKAWGGQLARYLYPKVIADEKTRNPQVNGSEAWAWLPPPLMDEGKKVQSDWLHDFLLDPYRIRPAVVMRMPRFNMSPEEATALADYFAAADGEKFPYEFNSRQRQAFQAKMGPEDTKRLENAMKIVLDNNYCVKCHGIGDFQPEGSPTGLGPDLGHVSRRLRPEYVRDWLANPKRILPYTGMPVNIPFKADDPHLGGVSQDLFPGTSVEQLDGVVDLLMNYDHYMQQQTSIRSRIKPATEEAPPAEEETAAEE